MKDKLKKGVGLGSISWDHPERRPMSYLVVIIINSKNFSWYRVRPNRHVLYNMDYWVHQSWPVVINIIKHNDERAGPSASMGKPCEHIEQHFD